MNYIKPKDVHSPKLHWRLHRVIYDGGEGGWAAAEGQWDDDGRWFEVVALRWNGQSIEQKQVGNPQSRGLPTWFIVPPELKEPVTAAILKINAQKTKKHR